MKIGTRSLLFGVHLWFWHPLVVAAAWWKLYGFPRDPRLWVAFLVHDWGYWECPEMDGPRGDLHPHRGAEIMHKLFDGWDEVKTSNFNNSLSLQIQGWELFGISQDCTAWLRKRRTKWHDFCLYHSRFLAKQNGAQPSKLCMADKLSLCLEPWWLYLPRAWASRELKGYMRSAEPGGKHGHMNLRRVTARQWYASVQKYLRQYVAEHKDGKTDTVTQANGDRFESGKNGVWL